MMKRKFLAAMLLLSLAVSTLTGCGQAAKLPEETGQIKVYQSLEDSLSVMPAFEATDLEGTPVDESIFENADITVVNCWGTFCTPCIDEMPKLAEWAKEMPENVQIVGLFSDSMNGTGKNNFKAAKKILKKSGAEFVQIVPDETLQDMLLGVLVYPTTFFIDRDGNRVGEVIEGADIDAYKNQVNTYLEELTDEVQSNS